MKNIPVELKEKFDQWTKGLETVTPMFPDPSTIIVIGKKVSGNGSKKGDVYDVLTFFKVGDNWEVSCDARDATADKAFYGVARRVSPFGSLQPDDAEM